jgi:methyl-accepting chemotaxis protein
VQPQTIEVTGETMPNIDTILIVMVAITGLSVLLQIIFLAVLAVTANKALKAGKEYAEEFRALATPVAQSSKEVLQQSRDLLHTTKDLIARLEPRLDAAATDLADMTRMAREETSRIMVSADEIQNRVRRQAARVDSMTTSVLNSADSAGHFLENVLAIPARQVSGVLAAARAVVNTLRSPSPAGRGGGQAKRANDETGQFV